MILGIFLILPRVKAGAEHVAVLLLLLAWLVLYVLRTTCQVLRFVYIRLTALRSTHLLAPVHLCTCALLHERVGEWVSLSVLVTR